MVSRAAVSAASACCCSSAGAGALQRVDAPRQARRPGHRPAAGRRRSAWRRAPRPGHRRAASPAPAACRAAAVPEPPAAWSPPPGHWRSRRSGAHLPPSSRAICVVERRSVSLFQAFDARGGGDQLLAQAPRLRAASVSLFCLALVDARACPASISALSVPSCCALDGKLAQRLAGQGVGQIERRVGRGPGIGLQAPGAGRGTTGTVTFW